MAWRVFWPPLFHRKSFVPVSQSLLLVLPSYCTVKVSGRSASWPLDFPGFTGFSLWYGTWMLFPVLLERSQLYIGLDQLVLAFFLQSTSRFVHSGGVFNLGGMYIAVRYFILPLGRIWGLLCWPTHGINRIEWSILSEFSIQSDSGSNSTGGRSYTYDSVAFLVVASAFFPSVCSLAVPAAC